MFDETQIQEQESIQEQPEEQVQEQAVETQQAKNFKMLREKSDRIERERDELARRLHEVESKKQASEDINLNPDDLVEWKHVDKKFKKLESELKDYQFRAKYPNFEQIVSPENVKNLESNHPELVSIIRNSSDVYSQGAATYELIKKLGISSEDVYKDDKERIDKNVSKPKPTSYISPQGGNSPLSRANAFENGLTDDLKKALWKEIQQNRQ